MGAVILALGGVSLRLATDLGGMTLVLVRILRGLLPPRLDGREFVRSMHSFGEASLPVAAATAAFAGMIMVLQGAVYVRRFDVYDLVGWYTGFAVFRETGPVLVGLMFSGRVGANNTSELATMRVTEQLDALRILAIDVYEFLVVPRTVSMVLAMGALVVFGDLVAVLAGAFCAKLLLDLPPERFFLGMFDALTPVDFLVGVEKGLAIGLMVAVISTYYGLKARGGSAGVGRSVNAQVVACAVAIFLTDYLVTLVVR